MKTWQKKHRGTEIYFVTNEDGIDFKRGESNGNIIEAKLEKGTYNYKEDDYMFEAVKKNKQPVFNIKIGRIYCRKNCLFINDQQQTNEPMFVDVSYLYSRSRRKIGMRISYYKILKN